MKKVVITIVGILVALIIGLTLLNFSQKKEEPHETEAQTEKQTEVITESVTEKTTELITEAISEKESETESKQAETDAETEASTADQANGLGGFTNDLEIQDELNIDLGDDDSGLAGAIG